MTRMSRSIGSSLKYSALAASLAILFAACAGTTTSTAPSTAPSTAASTAPSTAASAEAFATKSYPDTAVDCANPPAGYTGTISQIKSLDRLTVEFDMCAPDVAFLSKVAFSSNNIQDSDWLKAHATDKSSALRPSTGP